MSGGVESRQNAAGAGVVGTVLLLAVRDVVHEAAVHHALLPLHFLRLRAGCHDAEGYLLLHAAGEVCAACCQARGDSARGPAEEEEIVECVC